MRARPRACRSAEPTEKELRAETPQRGTGVHRLAASARRHAEVLLKRQEDFPCLVVGCPTRTPRALGYCQAHGQMALKGLVLGRRVVTAAERLWLMATAFRQLLNEVQRENLTVELAAARLWDLAGYHLLTDPPFHDIHAHLPMEGLIEARNEEYTWAGVVPELRERLPFIIESWEAPSLDRLKITASLDRNRPRVMGKARAEFVRDICLFLKQKKDAELETRMSIHLPLIAKDKAKLTKKPREDYYPPGREENRCQQPTPRPRKATRDPK